MTRPPAGCARTLPLYVMTLYGHVRLRHDAVYLIYDKATFRVCENTHLAIYKYDSRKTKQDKHMNIACFDLFLMLAPIWLGFSIFPYA